MTATIAPVRCLNDNYAYLVSAADAAEAWVVDPSDAAPIQEGLAARGLGLRGLLVTHHHADHVGGIAALSALRSDLVVAAHADDRGRVPGQTVFVPASTAAFAEVALPDFPGRLFAAHIPGHTRAAIAWALASDSGVITDVFTGDTLFGAGCGRLFEGTAEQMFGSLALLTSLPESTRLWFGHEYTAKNLAFAALVEPDNSAVTARAAALPAVTTPTTVAIERATNPFVRAADAATLARHRMARDRY